MLKRPRFSNPSWLVPGRGWLVLNVETNSLDAHCGCLHHKNVSNPCRLNRSLNAGPNPAAGKPVGLLLAWLFAHRGSHGDHRQMVKKSTQMAQDVQDLSLAARRHARQWARDNGLGHLESKESPKSLLGVGNEEPTEFVYSH
jgi:hypothetical protein